MISSLPAIPVAAINKQLKIFELFKALDITMPVGQMAFLLTAAKLEGQSLAEIASSSNTPASTASRYLTNLSVKRREGSGGLGLLRATENPDNRRQKIIELTSAGRELIEKLI